MSFERRRATSGNSCLVVTRFSCAIQDHLLNALSINLTLRNIIKELDLLAINASSEKE
ncbi:MAG: hypothetical protein GY787_31030 [Alteromonadales bacterium]|nr:hypothetical protein [Alteromonadales bacterium]